MSIAADFLLRHVNHQKIVYVNNLVKCVCGETIGHRTRPSRYKIVHLFRFAIIEIKDHLVCPIDCEASHPTNFFTAYENSIRQYNVVQPMDYNEDSDSESEPRSPDAIVPEQGPERSHTPSSPYSSYDNLNYSPEPFLNPVSSDYSYNPHDELRDFLISIINRVVLRMRMVLILMLSRLHSLHYLKMICFHRKKNFNSF